MTVRELIDALSAVDQARRVSVTLSYQTGDHAPISSVGTEGDASTDVYIFPATCLDGECP